MLKLKKIKSFMENASFKSWTLKPMMALGLAPNDLAKIRILHHLNGGKIVYTIRLNFINESNPKYCFMLEVTPGILMNHNGVIYCQPGPIIPNQCIRIINVGSFKVIDKKDKWEDFGIKNIKELNEITRYHRKRIFSNKDRFDRISKIATDYQTIE